MMKDKEKLFKQAKEVITKHNCVFIEDVISRLPLSKGSFYNFWSTNSEEYAELSELIDANKVSMKAELYQRWFKSDAPVLQISLMKLISTPSEAHRLNGSKQQLEVKQKVEELNYTDEERDARIKELIAKAQN